MAFELFQSQMAYGNDEPAFKGVAGWDQSQDGIAAFGTQPAKNAKLLSEMAGANLGNIAEMSAAKYRAQEWQKLQQQQQQAQKKKGLFGGILDIAGTALGFIPGIGTAAKIGIGLATQGAKSFL